MENDKLASTGRKLTMEEKRKLEKLLLADLDRAIADYGSVRRQEHCRIEKEMIKSPPRTVAALFASYKRARTAEKTAVQELEKVGFTVNCYRSEHTLDVRSCNPPKDLLRFNEETATRQHALNELKRTYTIKLFAGGAEAQELFTTLATEIASITK